VEQPDQDKDIDKDNNEQSCRGSNTGKPELEQGKQDDDPGNSLSGRRAGRAATPRRRSASVGSRRVSPRGENDPLVFHRRGAPPAGPPPPCAGLPPPAPPSWLPALGDADGRTQSRPGSPLALGGTGEYLSLLSYFVRSWASDSQLDSRVVSR
jgi:hypothetical protein